MGYGLESGSKLSTTTKLAGATAISFAIYAGLRKRFGDDKAAAAAVLYGLGAGAYIAKNR